MDFSKSQKKNGVFYLTEENLVFSDVYIAVREKENRILSDKEVALLPYLKRYEWPLREKSTERFLKYIASKNNALQILDIGCGNGWFSHKTATVSEKHQVIGLDVNSEELKQATRVFQKENLQFVYGDLFEMESAFKEQFDIITLNGAVQYFPDFKVLLTSILSFLKPNGEIHVIDSPFYEKNQIVAAKKRTLNYYTQMGFPSMAANYFHHDISTIIDFQVFYHKKRSYLNRLLGKNDSPFPWLCCKKSDKIFISHNK